MEQRICLVLWNILQWIWFIEILNWIFKCYIFLHKSSVHMTQEAGSLTTNRWSHVFFICLLLCSSCSLCQMKHYRLETRWNETFWFGFIQNKLNEKDDKALFPQKPKARWMSSLTIKADFYTRVSSVSHPEGTSSVLVDVKHDIEPWKWWGEEHPAVLVTQFVYCVPWAVCATPPVAKSSRTVWLYMLCFQNDYQPGTPFLYLSTYTAVVL